MKRMFNLCLVATLLSFGAACSKKTNSVSKEFEKRTEQLKVQKALKELEVKQKEEAAALKLKQDNAIEISDIIVADSEETSHVSLYQLLLAAELNGAPVAKLSTLNSEAEIKEINDQNKEMNEVSAKTGRSAKEICDKILKKLAKKNDSDLVKVDRAHLQSDVDGVVECRSLNLESDYIEVSKVKALCESAQKTVVAKKADAAPTAAPQEDVAPVDADQAERDAQILEEEKANADEAAKLEAEAKAKADAEAKTKAEQEKTATTNPEKTPAELKAEAAALRVKAEQKKVTAETGSKKDKKAAKKEIKSLNKEARKNERKAAKLEKAKK